MDYHDKTRKKYSSAVLKEQHMPPAAICGGGPSCETLRIISAPTLLTRAEPLQRSLWRALTTFAAGALSFAKENVITDAYIAALK